MVDMTLGISLILALITKKNPENILYFKTLKITQIVYFTTKYYVCYNFVLYFIWNQVKNITAHRM